MCVQYNVCLLYGIIIIKALRIIIIINNLHVPMVQKVEYYFVACYFHFPVLDVRYRNDNASALRCVHSCVQSRSVLCKENTNVSK